MRVMRNNYCDLATTVLTAASQSADLPVANIVHPHRTKVYRTLNTIANEYIRFDLGSAMAVQCVILLDHTLTASDTTIKLQGGATEGATTVDAVIVFNAGTMVLFLPSPQTYRYWQIIFTKSASGETRDIGRVYLGPFDEYALAPAQPDGLTITPVDLSNTSRALGGQSYSEIKGQYDEIGMEFPGAVSETQTGQMIALAAACGTHTPFFISIDQTNKPYDWLYYCKAKKLTARKVKLKNGATILWDASLEVDEQL